MARLTIVQYGGDYREAHDRFAAGGPATYQAQRYSLGFVAGLPHRHEQVSVVCSQTIEAYDAVLADGVRAVGCGFQGRVDAAEFVRMVAATAPTHLVITTPFRPLIRWALRQRIPTICVLADSFDRGGLRHRVRAWRLARLLRDDGVQWIGNHGLNACLSLLDIGVPADKIVPWDWPPSFRPHDYPVRSRTPAPLRLAYVGGVVEAKGVGDLLEALALLRRRGVAASADIIGRDAGGAMAARAAALGLGDAANFAGAIANEQIPAAMRAVDAVVVPSRHAYPEGMPLTIYEALSARTPILASDHPMFKGVLVDGQSAAIFRASDPGAMADAIEALGRDSQRYEMLSRNTLATWENLQLPVVWGDLIAHWLEDGEAGCGWLRDHAISSGLYDARLAERRLARSA